MQFINGDQEFAEEEGPNSPFASLSSNLTHLLTAILLMTTTCSIYSTAIFVSNMSLLMPTLSLGVLSASLTILTVRHLFGISPLIVLCFLGGIYVCVYLLTLR